MEYGANVAASTIGFAAPLYMYFLGDPNILSAITRGAFYSLASQGILDVTTAIIRSNYNPDSAVISKLEEFTVLTPNKKA